MKIPKRLYWSAIVDYYYDNIHWDEPGPPSLYEWLKRDYNAITSLHSKDITFSDDKSYTWFMLRWGTECEKST